MFPSFLNLRVSTALVCTILSPYAGSAQSPVAPATNTVIAFGYGVGMLQAGDQNFYGISTSIEVPCVPNVGECDKIYQVTPTGMASVFYTFGQASSNSANNPSGCQLTGLIVGTDGDLYGTCIYGGSGGNGTITLTVSGELTQNISATMIVE
jgi:hypothetical protein